MTTSRLRWFAVALLIGACALPAVEIDESLGASGSGGGGSGGGAGSSGKGGSAGGGAIGGNGGTGSGGSAGTVGTDGGQAGAGAEDLREEACFEYCATYIEACANHEANSYDNVYDCDQVCATSGWPFSTDGDDRDEPNSLQCRRAHAGFALTMPNPHCYHSAEVPSMMICALPAD